jgi:hypothetical protein
MDSELKEYLEAMEGQIGGHLDATLVAMEGRIGGHLDATLVAMEGRVGGLLDATLVAIEARLDAKIESVETTLLTEFHKWASPAELRARSHAAAIRALDLETEALAERVAKLEKPA